MEFGSFGLSQNSAKSVPGRQWTTVPFDTETADPYNSHSGTGETFLVGQPCKYAVEATIDFDGVPPGTEVSVKVAEYVYDTSGSTPVDKLVRVKQEKTCALPSTGRIHYAGVGNLESGRKLRLQVWVDADGDTFSVKGARVEYLAQR